ncbi:MAG: hypothetical protein IT580_20845, partial [Verrucomicrobiales bacterium]|nr:hypothetical protein [Verrucomicrobiales bacterium]
GEERAGGGGGGRIALYFDSDDFTGDVRACGGVGGEAGKPGGAGTIYRRRVTDLLGTLTIDNCGRLGGATDLEPTTELAAHVIVRGGGTLAHRRGESPAVLTITGDLHVEADGLISARGRGFPTSDGPGSTRPVSCCSSGGSHAGTGGVGRDAARAGSTYGSIFEPQTAGSGGGRTLSFGDGGAGGGALKLIVQGTLRNDGHIDAEGAPGEAYAGGGAGGSLWIVAPRLTGGGAFSVVGGSGSALGGGGGGGGRLALEYDQDTFTGVFLIHGGDAGESSQFGGAGTFHRKVRSAARGLVLIDNAGRTNGVTEVDREFDLDADLRLRGGAILATRFETRPSTFRLRGTVTVETHSALSASGRGYPENQGPGSGARDSCCTAGASHAGSGGEGRDGSPPGANYGSITEPSEAGSGAPEATSFSEGQGGDGGGALRLIVEGELRVDGRIESEGGAGGSYAGGGSGGSLWISTPRLAGSGTLSVAGGPGSPLGGGGGGGGRLALYVAQNAFTGTFATQGGRGIQVGGSGTTYLKLADAPRGLWILDNGGQTNGVTEVDSTFSFTEDVLIRHGAILAPRARGIPWNLHFPGNLHIAAGGVLSATGRGFAGGDGAGAPGPVPSYAAGGSHGGRGGHGDNHAAVTTHGSLTEPQIPGSGGGNTLTFGEGGRGGGAVRLRVDGELRIDGRLEAEGTTGGSYAGAGAGGSLWIQARQLTGSGRISAQGGSALRNDGGGGGGGRVALYFDTLDDALLDQLTAGGGDGAQQGGGGTLYLKANASPVGEIIVDRSPLDKDTAPTEFWGHVRIPGSLRIRSGALVSHPQGHPFQLGVQGDLTLASGGFINLDGLGYPAETGPGGAPDNAGAGHGAPGGTARDGTPGGCAYGDPLNPIDLGSGAGNRAGGGAAQLNIQGTLRLEGLITANATRSTSGGGASGGSLRIHASRVEGDGFILADGGEGASQSNTGGGAGGRIALFHHSPTFDTNHLSARGGAGFRAGSHGTVHVVVKDAAEAPRLESALASPSLTEVVAVFTDVLDRVTAEDPTRYTLDGSVLVRAAELQTDLRTVLLTTTPLTGGATYTLNAVGVRNGLGIPTPAGTTSPAFVARGTLRGVARQEVYTRVNGSRLGDLYADPRWPTAPTLSSEITRLAAQRDAIDGDQLGARLTGYLIPDVSGWHRFYLASDDNGVFYLSEDHSPANLQLVASEPQRSAAGDWTAGSRPEVTASRGVPPANVSTPVWLAAGRHYWFDARFKEDTATEHLAVTWQNSTESPPLPNEGTRLAGDRLARPIADSGPQIRTPPQGGDFPLGATLLLRVEASGTPPLRYQWYQDGAPLPGATSDALDLGRLGPAAFGSYRVRVSDAVGAVDSPVATVVRALPESPAVTEPPQDQVALLGSTVLLEGVATGAEPLAYQWRLNGQEILGATAPFLRLPSLRTSDAGAYTLVVSNPFGSSESTPAQVTLSLPLLPLADSFALRPVFTTTNGIGTTNNLVATHEEDAGEPRHAGKRGGRSIWFTWRAPTSGVARFTTAGSGFDTLLAVYAGTSLAELRVVAADDDSGGYLTSAVRFNAVAGTEYQVALDGYAGASGDLVLAWELHPDAPPLPSISRQPTSVLGVVGDTTTLSLAFTPATTRVQWFQNDRELPGQTLPSLRLSPVVPSLAGTYHARLLTPEGAVLESARAVLEITDQPTTAGALSADKLEDLFGPDESSGLQTKAVPHSNPRHGPGLAASPPVAIGLPGSQWTDNSQSSRGDEDPTVCQAIAIASRWFRFRFNVPGGPGTTVRLSTEGTEGPALVAVFTNRAALRLVACDLAHPPAQPAASVQFLAQRGVDYLVLVDTPSGRQGPIKLNWNGEETAPPLVTLRDGRLFVELRVAPALYAWQRGSALGAWETLWRTNLPGGVFQYTDPDPATDAVRFFRLLPAPP